MNPPSIEEVASANTTEPLVAKGVETRVGAGDLSYGGVDPNLSDLIGAAAVVQAPTSR